MMFKYFYLIEMRKWEMFHEHVFVCSIRDITKEIAAAVIMEAIEEDLVEGYRGVDARELRKFSKVDSIVRNFPNLVSSDFCILFVKQLQ